MYKYSTIFIVCGLEMEKQINYIRNNSSFISNNSTQT